MYLPVNCKEQIYSTQRRGLHHHINGVNSGAPVVRVLVTLAVPLCGVAVAHVTCRNKVDGQTRALTEPMVIAVPYESTTSSSSSSNRKEEYFLAFHSNNTSTLYSRTQLHLSSQTCYMYMFTYYIDVCLQCNLHAQAEKLIIYKHYRILQ